MVQAFSHSNVVVDYNQKMRAVEHINTRPINFRLSDERVLLTV